MEQTSTRAEWSCASIISGELSVMTCGAQMMLPLSVNSWDMLTLDVRYTPGIFINSLISGSFSL